MASTSTPTSLSFIAGGLCWCQDLGAELRHELKGGRPLLVMHSHCRRPGLCQRARAHHGPIICVAIEGLVTGAPWAGGFSDRHGDLGRCTAARGSAFAQARAQLEPPAQGTFLVFARSSRVPSGVHFAGGRKAPRDPTPKAHQQA